MVANMKNMWGFFKKIAIEIQIRIITLSYHIYDYANPIAYFRKSILTQQANQALLSAVDSGNILMLANSLKFSDTVDIMDKSQNTPLLLAAKKGTLIATIMLIESGADIDHANEHGLTALMLAVINNQYVIFYYLLTRGSNILLYSLPGNTVLQWCISYSRINMLDLMIAEHQINLNGRYREGNTLLLNAVFANNLDVIKWLLGHGSRLDNLNDSNESALTLSKKLKRDLIHDYLEQQLNIGKKIYNRRDKTSQSLMRLHLSLAEAQYRAEKFFKLTTNNDNKTHTVERPISNAFKKEESQPAITIAKTQYFSSELSASSQEKKRDFPVTLSSSSSALPCPSATGDLGRPASAPASSARLADASTNDLSAIIPLGGCANSETSASGSKPSIARSKVKKYHGGSGLFYRKLQQPQKREELLPSEINKISSFSKTFIAQTDENITDKKVTTTQRNETEELSTTFRTLDVTLPHYVQKVMFQLEELGFQIYLVGGCVRDMLLNKKSSDFDMICNAPIQAVSEHVRLGTFSKHISNLYRIFLPESHIDIVCLNVLDLSLDAKKRDFTCNALYLNRKCQMFDPLNGIEDVLQKQVVTITEPALSFQEDPIRLLRLARLIAQHQFIITDLLEKTIKQNAKFLKNCQPGRLQHEIRKLFLHGSAVNTYWVLKRLALLPELFIDVPKNIFENPLFDQWVTLKLNQTDELVQLSQPVSLYYILAIFKIAPSVIQNKTASITQLTTSSSITKPQFYQFFNEMDNISTQILLQAREYKL